MKRFSLIIAISFLAYHTNAQSIIYEREDSLKVVELLAAAPAKGTTNDYMSYFGNRLKGLPYVAKTLETTKKENLIINLRELDCTTFTENILALSLCMKSGKRTFLDFSNFLRQIRYKDGRISYPARNHYFTAWIDENTRNGFIKEHTASTTPFTATQTIALHYMSTHHTAYPALVRDTSLIKNIRTTEKQITGRRFRYIPKHNLARHALLKKHIKNGDIIVILTKKPGLDTSHIGIASWHNDGTLHLLNASQIHKKVVDEPMTLFKYMQKHPSQIGIRVVRPL